MSENLKIFTNKVTRDAIIYTLLVLLVYRIGSFIPSPGIDLANLELIQGAYSSEVTTLFDFFGGGNISQMTIFALGVSPYITASIMIQLLENELVPSMNEWKRQGVEGQNKRSNYTKNLALILAFAQAIGITYGISLFNSNNLQVVAENTYTFDTESMFNFLNNIPVNFFIVALIMTAGTAILMWLADRITEKGIGNGMSVMIMAGIIASMPSQIISSLDSIVAIDTITQQLIQALILAIISIITIIVIIMVIYYNLAYRKISINYVRSGRSNIRKNSYMPIKLNPAGVIPVIFAAPFLLMVNMASKFMLGHVGNNELGGTLDNIFLSLSSASYTYWYLYVLVYAALIILFSVFYSYVQMNPENMTENLQKQSAYVVGVRPGEDTLDYLSNVILRTSFWGGSILAIIAVLPVIITNLVTTSVSLQLLGTGLIIVVSVLVQTYSSLVNKIESKNYRYLIGETK